MPTFVKVDGLRELKAALAEFSKSTARGVQQRALMKAAQPIVAAAKAKAPVLYGDLRDSITVTTKRPRGRSTPAARAFAQTVAAGGSVAAAKAASRAAGAGPVEVFVGPGRMPQASLQEFGTRFHGPHPYLRPAIDQEGARAKSTVAALTWEEIRKTAERVARRQVKKALR